MPDNIIRLPYTAEEVQELLAINKNFIPSETVFNIEADGSGDFATIHDCIQYLQGKHCSGGVTIQLGEGTFVTTETINTAISGIAGIRLIGAGTDKSVISLDASEFGTHTSCVLCDRNTTLIIDNLGFYITNPPEGFRCIMGMNLANISIGKVKIDANAKSYSSWAIMSEQGANIKVHEADISNFYHGITAADATVFIPYGSKFSFQNVCNCFRASDGGYMGVSYLGQCTTSNINNKWNTDNGALYHQ